MRVWRKPYILIEVLLIFVALPWWLTTRGAIGVSLIIPSLLLCTLYGIIVLKTQPGFSYKKEHSLNGWRKELPRILLQASAGAIALSLIVWQTHPEQLYRLPTQHTGLWLFIIFAYPIASVYPQEVLYRTFLFARLKPLIGENHFALLTISAISFGLAHSVFANWQAVALTIVGGYLFAYTYHRTRSLLLCSLEHALWGNLIFTIGLGEYFLGGTVVTLISQQSV